MKEPEEILISIFENMKSHISRTIPLYQEFGNIKRGKYKELIKSCREAVTKNDTELYSTLKSQLPAVTFCGVFNGVRKASNVIEYNSLLIFDIDNLDSSKLNEFKLKLHNDSFVMALWLSPSGKGLKGVVRIDSDIENHKNYFNALKIYFLNKYEIELDRSGSDVSRLCFCSWDENFYFNKNSNIFKEYLELELVFTPVVKKDKVLKDNFLLNKNAYSTEGFNRKNDTTIIREIIKFLEKNDVSITESYDSWVKVALGISSVFSYDVGERYFLKICSLDKDKHFEDKSIALLKYCYNKRKLNFSDSISLATIVFFAKQKGFIVKKTKYT